MKLPYLRIQLGLKIRYYPHTNVWEFTEIQARIMMHKKLSKSTKFGVAVMALVFAPFAFQQSRAADIDVDIEAVIVSAISLSEIQPMNFSTLVPGAAGGTFVIDPMGGISPTGGVMSMAGSAQPAVITITADPGVQLVTSTDTSVTLLSGSNSMTVTDFNILTPAGGDSETITLTQPSEDIPIGATLQIGASQPPGTYVGQFTYTVDYQ